MNLRKSILLQLQESIVFKKLHEDRENDKILHVVYG